MRIFTRLRSFLLFEKEIKGELQNLKHDTGKMFQIVFERLDTIEERPLPRKRKIGLK